MGLFHGAQLRPAHSWLRRPATDQAPELLQLGPPSKDLVTCLMSSCPVSSRLISGMSPGYSKAWSRTILPPYIPEFGFLTELALGWVRGRYSLTRGRAPILFTARSPGSFAHDTRLDAPINTAPREVNRPNPHAAAIWIGTDPTAGDFHYHLALQGRDGVGYTLTGP